MLSKMSEIYPCGSENIWKMSSKMVKFAVWNFMCRKNWTKSEHKRILDKFWINKSRHILDIKNSGQFSWTYSRHERILNKFWINKTRQILDMKNSGHFPDNTSKNGKIKN
jgi:hypothetical protein